MTRDGFDLGHGPGRWERKSAACVSIPSHSTNESTSVKRNIGVNAPSSSSTHLQNIDLHAAVVHGIDTVLRGLAAQLEERKAGSKARRPGAN
jgi:hypothetical protein